MNETAERLMDLAEARIREAGYRGFSFRDLAAEIGIKSASVHQPFPDQGRNGRCGRAPIRGSLLRNGRAAA